MKDETAVPTKRRALTPRLKDTKFQRVSFNLSQAQVEKLMEIAAAEFRPLADQLAYAIHGWLQEYEEQTS